MPNIKVIGAVLDTRCLTVYDDTGKSHEISHTVPGFENLVDKLIPIIQKGGTYQMNTDTLENPQHDPNFHDFQEKNTFGIRFKRLARSVVNTLFGTQDTPAKFKPGTYGDVVPTTEDTVEKQKAAAQEIVRNAKPISRNTPVHSDDNTTLVATLGDAVIPDADKLKSYLATARRINDYRGLQNLILRLSSMIGERQHSIIDVLKFLERGDLPVTDRGDILAYKKLYNKGEFFVDPHTQKVQQRPGDFVCLPVAHVNKNRSQECSYGLHVGRRDYMGNFSGDTLFLISVAPEDLIAVPHGDPNKVRVCGYHILEQLSKDMANKVYSKQPFASGTDGAELLAKAVQGGFGAPKRIVEIVNETTKELAFKDAPENFIGQTVFTLPDGVMGTANLTEFQKGERVVENIEPPVDKSNMQPESVPQSKIISRVKGAITKANTAKKKAEAKKAKVSAAPKPKAQSRQERVQEMIKTAYAATGNDQITAAQAVLNFKRTSKTGWDKLGVSVNDQNTLATMATRTPTTDAPAPAAKANPRQEKAQQLLATYSDHGNSTHERLTAAKELLALKKTAKVGWDRLGISDTQVLSLKDFVANPPVASPAVTPKKGTQLNKKQNRRQREARVQFENKNWSNLLSYKRKAKIGWAAFGFSQKEIDEIKLHIGD